MQRHPSLPSGNLSTGGRGGSASPTSTSSTASSSQNAQRIEVIRNYYQQLCANLRAVMQHLQIPDLAPQRRQAMLMQKEKLEQSLQEFSERVLRPLAQNQQNQQLQQHTRSASLPPAVAGEGNGGGGGGMMGGMQNMSQNQNQMPSSTSSGFSPFPYNTFQMTPQGAVGPTGLMYSNRPYNATSSIHSPIISANTNSMARQAIIIAQQQQQIIQQQQWIFQQRLQSSGTAPSPSKRNVSKSVIGSNIVNSIVNSSNSILGGNAPSGITGGKAVKASSPLKSTIKQLTLSSNQISPIKRNLDTLFSDYSTGSSEPVKSIQSILGFDIKLNKKQEKQLFIKADLFLNELIDTACQIAANRSAFDINSRFLNRRDVEVALNLKYPNLLPGTQIPSPTLRKNKKVRQQQENTAKSGDYGNIPIPTNSDSNSINTGSNGPGVIVIPNISIVKDSHQNKMSQLKKYLLSINQPLN